MIINSQLKIDIRSPYPPAHSTPEPSASPDCPRSAPPLCIPPQSPPEQTPPPPPPQGGHCAEPGGRPVQVIDQIWFVFEFESNLL